MSDQLYIYEGRQYPADRLPKGVDVKDLQTAEEFFGKARASSPNKQAPAAANKAVGAPTADKAAPAKTSKRR